MPDGTLVAHVFPGAGVFLATTEAFDDDLWHHVAICQSIPGGFQLYVDGTLRDSEPSAISAQSRDGYWRFGGWLVDGRNAFDPAVCVNAGFVVRVVGKG